MTGYTSMKRVSPALTSLVVTMTRPLPSTVSTFQGKQEVRWGRWWTVPWVSQQNQTSSQEGHCTKPGRLQKKQSWASVNSPVSGMTTLSTVNTEHCAQLSDGQTMEIEDSESRPVFPLYSRRGWQDARYNNGGLEDYEIIQSNS